MGWQDAPVVEADEQKGKWAEAPLVDAEPSLLDRLKQLPTGRAGFNLGLDYMKAAQSAAMRPLAKAASSIPVMAADAGVAIRNVVENASRGVYPSLRNLNPFSEAGWEPGPYGYELPSSQFNRSLDQYTIAPEGFPAKASEFVSTVLAGSQIPAPRGPEVPRGFTGYQPQPSATSESASRAAAGSSASATATPGVAATETTLAGGATARGTGGGYTFGTVGDDASAGLTDAQRSILERGRQLGMRATPGQATGSRALQQLEAKLESQPMTSGPFNALKSSNARVLNREAARAIGENADSLDSAVLDRAARRIGEVFDDAADDAQREINPGQFLRRYSEIQDDIRGLVSGFGDHPLVQDLTKFAEEGQASGRQLQSLTSKLGKAAYKQMTGPTGDRDLGMALYRVKDYVDDLLQQGMEPARAATFQQARSQYRNLMLLTGRVGVVNPSTGNVSGRSLANVLQSKDRSGFLLGRNQSGMYDAAHFAQAFQPIVGDSGTATRSALPSPTDFVLSLPFNMATRAYLSSPAVNLATSSQAAASAATNAGAGVAGGVLNPRGMPLNPMLLPPVYEGLLSQRPPR
jgi:hypothetical protein